MLWQPCCACQATERRFAAGTLFVEHEQAIDDLEPDSVPPETLQEIVAPNREADPYGSRIINSKTAAFLASHDATVRSTHRSACSFARGSMRSGRAASLSAPQREQLFAHALDLRVREVAARREIQAAR